MLQAVAAGQALELIGMPEARLSMTQAILAICNSPKSNSVVMAIDAAMADAEKGGFGPVPPHLRDSSYKGNERLGVKTDTEYKYPHDYPGHWVAQQYLPDDHLNARYYFPSDQGSEAKLKPRNVQNGK